MFVGDTGVGKSSIINSYMGIEGTKSVEPTNGVEICFKKYRVKNDLQYINVILHQLTNKIFYN